RGQGRGLVGRSGVDPHVDRGGALPDRHRRGGERRVGAVHADGPGDGGDTEPAAVPAGVAGQARRVVGGAGMIGELVHVADDLVVAPAPHPLVAPHEAIPGEDVAGVVAAVVADRLLQVGRTGVAYAVGLDRPPVRDGEVEGPGAIGGAA